MPGIRLTSYYHDLDLSLSDTLSRLNADISSMDLHRVRRQASSAEASLVESISSAKEGLNAALDDCLRELETRKTSERDSRHRVFNTNRSAR